MFPVPMSGTYITGGNMKEAKDLEELRDVFREAADKIDNIINICKREEQGEDVKEEYETAMGRFMVTMMKMQALQG